VSTEIQRAVVEEGIVDEEAVDACTAFLKQHRLGIGIVDNRRFRHNESKLIREANFIATVTGVFFNGYGDTEKEAVEDFRRVFNEFNANQKL
jgi:hypothetical protein